MPKGPKRSRQPALRRTLTKRGGVNTTAGAHALSLSRRYPAGQAGSLTYPGSEAFRRSVQNGICPFCGAGPFLVVATHCNKIHDVGRLQLREMAGLFYTTSIADPEYSARVSARMKKVMTEHPERVAAFRKRTTSKSKKQRHKKSPAAKKQDLEKLQAYKRNLSPAAQAANMEKLKKALTPEMRAHVGRLNSERRLAATAERDRQIASEYNTGASLADLVRKFDLRPGSVRNILIRQEVWQGDGRQRYAEKRRGYDRPELQKAREEQQRRQKEEAESRKARYEAGVSLRELAEETGVTVKSITALLRKMGCDVPDGRANRVVEMLSFICPECGEEASRPASSVRNNRRQGGPGYGGPYCSRSCGYKGRNKKVSSD
jgi:lambda repressor-like predicted transcriptional regulator